ncbi:MAG: IS66 family transposase [Ktedonobacteraceae bacterium]|nr:IS66 family transposase [Ktedonobacteraceae bacterium]
MTEEEEFQLREKNSLLQEQVSLQKQLIERQHEQISLLDRQNSLQYQQITLLTEQVNTLQAQLSKDSHNSHLPPSSDRFVRQPRSLRKKSGKKPGGQKGHEGHQLHLSETPDEVIRHAVSICSHCHADLRQVVTLPSERRQVIEVVSKPVLVQEHQAEAKCCPHCQQITLAAFPSQVSAPLQYGPRLGAIAVYLIQQQLLPYARTSEILSDVLDARVSVGTLVELVARTAHLLEPVEEWIKDQLRQAEVLHQDETGLYVQGKRSWMHVSATQRLTPYQVHPKRGRDALETIGILSDFAGTSVHDGWASYRSYTCEHALCNVHHLRELTFLEETYQQSWAHEMKTMLLDLKAAVDEARDAGRCTLHPQELSDWNTRYTDLLLMGDQESPCADEPVPKQKGRRKQHPARNLLDRLSTYRDAVLRFAVNFAVPFDNSQAERDLRMVKVQQKVSGCFRSVAGAEAFCRIRGYLSCLRKQGLNPLNALHATLLGHPLFPAF